MHPGTLSDEDGYVRMIGVACSLHGYWRCGLCTQIPLAVALGFRGPAPSCPFCLRKEKEGAQHNVNLRGEPWHRAVAGRGRYLISKIHLLPFMSYMIPASS